MRHEDRVADPKEEKGNGRGSRKCERVVLEPTTFAEITLFPSHLYVFSRARLAKVVKGGEGRGVRCELAGGLVFAVGRARRAALQETRRGASNTAS